MEFKRCSLPTLLLILGLARSAGALDWRVEAEDLQIGPLEIGRLAIDRASASLALGPLRYGEDRPLGAIAMRCTAATLSCQRASLDWTPPDRPALHFDLVIDASEVRLDGQGLRLVLSGTGAQGRHLSAAADLGALPEAARELLGLSSLEGTLQAGGVLSPTAQRFEIELRGIGFDTPDGRIAAADLALDLELDLESGSEGDRQDARWRLQAKWTEGEALLGPLWLPPPELPLELRLEASPGPDCAWAIETLALDQADRLALRAAGRFDPCRGHDGVDATLALEHMDLAAAWALGLESLAAASGWSGLEPGGTLAGSAALVQGRLEHLQLRLDGASLTDPVERLGIDDLALRLDWQRQDALLEARADWAGASIHRISFGAAAIEIGGDADAVRLRGPVSIPVLDGAVRLDHLEWRDWTGEQPDLRMAATLEPVDLARLTRTLGWTEFGGSLSGRIPGLRFADGVVALDGGLDLNLFDGRARVANLSLERPFGTLPALAADLEFERLDLALVTGAFEIGSMRGRVSGHVRDLRLLNWQPVRFDAWFETLDTGSDRWISQKAVDSLSTLGGGGGAALSGTLLQVFDDFPYRRIGLGCRLDRNVCEMRGLETVDSGGYLIIEGRPLPVLNVVGHRKRVDWPQLLSQLRELAAPG